MLWATIIHMLLPTAIWACFRFQRHRTVSEGEIRRYSPVVRLLSWVALILSPVFPICLALILQGKRTQDVWLIRSCFAGAWIFLLLGLYAWRETRFGYLAFTSEGIQRFSPWTGTSVLEWDKIDAVRISSKGIVALSDADGARLTLIPHIWADMDSIMDAINKHVSAGAFVGI